MLLILAASLCFGNQVNLDGPARWANNVPIHGTLHKDRLYGFFARKHSEGLLIFAVPVENPAEAIKRFHLGMGDHDYYYRQHVGFGGLWHATGRNIITRMPLDDLRFFDQGNPKRLEDFNRKYPAANGNLIHWFFCPLHQLSYNYDRQRTPEETFIQPGTPFRHIKGVVGTDVVPTSETSCRVFFYARKEKFIESWETHAKLFTKTEPTKVIADNKNVELIDASFVEPFSAFIRGADYFFVTESGKLYHAPPREEGQKTRKMREVWTEPTLPIVAIISDADNDKVWLFVKNKSKGGKADLYLEMRDVARFKEIDPAQLAKVKDVESPRARQLLEYIPLIRPDLAKKPAP